MPTFQIENTDSQCNVTWRHFHSETFAGFLILAVLVVGFVLLTQLPLWGLSVFFITLAVCTWSGQTKIALNADGLNVTYTSLLHKRAKWFDLADIRRFEKQIRYNHGKLSSGQFTYLLRMVCQNARSCKSFGVSSKEELEEELDALCDQLNVFLGTLKAERAGVPAQWEVPEAIAFDFDSPPQHLAPPPACRWQYQTDYFGGVSFTKRNVFDFFGATTWTFAHGEAECRTARFGFARTAQHKLTGWRSLLVSLPVNERVSPALIAEGDVEAIRNFYDASDLWQVVFCTAEADRLLSIEGLCKGEALWMADVLLRERRAVG
jgi:hypothetical protein